MEKKVNKLERKSDNEGNGNEISNESTDSDVEYLSHIRCISGSQHKFYREIMLKVYINEKKLSMELDTGASVFLISYKQKQELLLNVQLLFSDVKLKTITGQRVKVLGKCYVDVFRNGQLKQCLPLYVVEGDSPALFGWEWLSEIKVELQNLYSVNKVARPRSNELDNILKEYDTLFKEELGTVKSVEAKLKVKDEAKAKFFKPRPVPFALKAGIEKEIKRLIDLGVIEKSDYSEWAAPIVPVKKPNDKIRICGDYKVTINQYLENSQHTQMNYSVH